MTASTPSSGPQLFHCPTCGAALPAPGDVASVRCEYCGSTILVPQEFRKSKEPAPQPFAEASYGQPVVINIGGEPDRSAPVIVQRRAGALGGMVVTLVIICVVFSGVIALLSATGVLGSLAFVNQIVQQDLPPLEVTLAVQNIAPATPDTLTPEPSPTPSFFQLALQFGAKGAGPGQFDDARYLAVDSGGNIFTAEYTDGRMQKFSPDGKFLALVNIPPDQQDYTTISDLAADYAGRVYVVRRGDILVYNAADGAQVGSIPGHFPDTWYETLVVDPANTLYALHVTAGELDLIKMDASGKQLYRKPQITAGLVKKNEVSRVEKMAVDGLGNLYLLDSSQYQVYKFDPDGNFIDRFGGKGDGPGLLENVSDLTVDGQGRIYVLNQDGIEIFDRNGVSLKLIPREYQGWASDIQLDLQGNLYIITNIPQVYKYQVYFSQ